MGDLPEINDFTSLSPIWTAKTINLNPKLIVLAVNRAKIVKNRRGVYYWAEIVGGRV